MANEKLKYYMLQIPTPKIESYLDENLLTSLLEWNSDAGLKTKLSEIIITIKGISILEKKEFREDILKTFPEKQILELKKYLPKKYEENKDLNKIVNIISKQPWKPSELTKHFLEYLGYNEEEVFQKDNESIEAIEKMESHEKFYELLDYQYIIRQQVLTKLKSKDPEDSLTRMLVNMPTGTGKTKTAMHIICNH